MEKDIKKCPYCGEAILAVAKKCKYCGEWLEEKTLVTKKMITCPVCAELIEEGIASCPYCHEALAFPSVSQENKPTHHHVEEKQRITRR